jgi:hypothetical protein
MVGETEEKHENETEKLTSEPRNNLRNLPNKILVYLLEILFSVKCYRLSINGGPNLSMFNFLKIIHSLN